MQGIFGFGKCLPQHLPKHLVLFVFF